MRRKYTTNMYKSVVSKIKNAFPNASIGADIIVGYPGETEKQFQNTFNLLREWPITHFHVFPYSKRKYTTAARLDNHIHSSVKKSRVKSLNMFGDAKLNSFSSEQIGSISDVLFEKRDEQGFFMGYTTNYIKVRVSSDEDLKNQILPVRLTKIVDCKLYGEVTLQQQALQLGPELSPRHN